MKYAAVKNSITHLKESEAVYKEISSYIASTQIEGNPNVVIKNLYALRREPEHQAFRSALHNTKLLFHGSNGMSYLWSKC